MANIVLDTFDADITLSEMAVLKGKIFLLKGVDACAVYELSIGLLRSMFLYETNAEFNLSTVKYYTKSNPDFFFNPANAQLNNPKSFGAIASADSNGLYSSDKMTLKYDFIRYLALKLFNTINAVDLFVNIDELVDDITEKLKNAMKRNMAYIDQCDCIHGTNSELRTNKHKTTIYDHTIDEYVNVYAKYLDDDCDKNICRELLLQLLKLDSKRFNDIVNTNAPKPLPFECGDSINFKIKVNPAKNQNLLTGVQNILGRTYQIKIVLTDEVVPCMPMVACKPCIRTKKRVASAYNPKHNPTIIFKYLENLPINYWDFVLFRFNIYIRDRSTIVVNQVEKFVYNYRSISGLLQIYPKAFLGVRSTCGRYNTVFSNFINDDQTYEIKNNSHGFYGRMFYLIAKDFDSNISVQINSDGCFQFLLNENENRHVTMNIELLNVGKISYEAITTKYFDINIL